MESKKKFDITLDLLNIFACFSVVALHVNNEVHHFSYERYWLTCMIIQVIFYYGVPLFFMISGATLMNYRRRNTTAQYFKKRFSRTLFPFLFWSIVAVLWSVYYEKSTSIDIHSIKSVLNAIINTKPMSIYWFFIPLFACYLAIPVLSLIPEESRKSIFLYMMVYSFLAESLLPTLFKCAGLTYNAAIRNPLNGGGYIFYLLCGYYFYNYEVPLKFRRLIYILGLCGPVIHYAGRVLLSYRDGADNSLFSGYCNFPCVLTSIAIFVFFKYQDFSSLDKHSQIIRKIAGASFGIYLIHFYYMKDIVALFSIDMRSWTWRVFGTPFIYLTMLAFVLLIKKIPLLNKLLP